MDMDTIRTLMTVLTFAMFAGVVWWALRARNEERFMEAAQLPFADEAPEESVDSTGRVR